MQNILDFLEDPLTAKLCPQLRKECQDWLKSLPERFNLEPKEEWNEEDEACKQTILCAVQGKFVTDAALRQAILWLKSLRSCPKSSDNWKPSEEQMEALKNSAYGAYQNGDGPALRELYEQLEKL